MSVQNFLIPLVNVPQQFEITLAGVDYQMINKWNPAPDAGWVLDIFDVNGVLIVGNVPLITGANILEGLDYLGFGGSMFVVTTGANATDVPTLENLGVESNLYFQVTTNG